jgi:hypothetical protein
MMMMNKLEKLYVDAPGGLDVARGMAKLSSLRSLQDVGISFSSSSPGRAFDSTVAAALGVLPLKALRVDSIEFSAAFVQQLTRFQHLTCLAFRRTHGKMSDPRRSAAL